MGLPIAALRAELEGIKKLIPPSGTEIQVAVFPAPRPGEPDVAFERRYACVLLPLMGSTPSVKIAIHTMPQAAEDAALARCSPALQAASAAYREGRPCGAPPDPAARVMIDPLS